MTLRPYIFILPHNGIKTPRERLKYASDLEARKFAEQLATCLRVETDSGRVVWRKTDGFPDER